MRAQLWLVTGLMLVNALALAGPVGANGQSCTINPAPGSCTLSHCHSGDWLTVEAGRLNGSIKPVEASGACGSAQIACTGPGFCRQSVLIAVGGVGGCTVNAGDFGSCHAGPENP